jgi:hypothetical protein
MHFRFTIHTLGQVCIVIPPHNRTHGTFSSLFILVDKAVAAPASIAQVGIAGPIGETGFMWLQGVATLGTIDTLNTNPQSRRSRWSGGSSRSNEKPRSHISQKSIFNSSWGASHEISQILQLEHRHLGRRRCGCLSNRHVASRWRRGRRWQSSEV